MNESELKKHLSAFADGELDEPTRARVEAALREHPALQDDVRRWQSLREAVRGVVERTPVPAGLADRVSAGLRDAAHAGPARRGIRAPRYYRLGLSGIAAAAVITLAVTLWPRGAAATTVDADAFVRVHRVCAQEHRHDAARVRGCGRCDVDARLKECAPFCDAAPEFAPCRAYRLDGACRCFPVREVGVLHTYFRCEVTDCRVVSVFTVDKPVRLIVDGRPCPLCEKGARHYHAAQKDGVGILAWTDDGRSFVVVAQLPKDELIALANDITVAHAGAAAPPR